MTPIVDPSPFYIYSITNRMTGGVYVGQTKNAQERWTQHLRDLRKGTHFNARLQRSFTKHGEEAFSYAVLACYATVAECCAAESAEIARSQAAGCSYNLKTEVTLFGGHMTQDVRERMSIAHRGEANYQYGRRGPAAPGYGHKHSEQTRELMGTCKRGEKNPMWGKPSRVTGRPMSEATKAKISASRTGVKLSAEHRAAASARMTGAGNPFFGRKHSAASIEKMRAAHKGQPSAMAGRHHSEETRGKLSAAAKGRAGPNKGKPSPLRGRSLSEETRQRMSQAVRARWAARRAATEPKA